MVQDLVLMMVLLMMGSWLDFGEVQELHEVSEIRIQNMDHHGTDLHCRDPQRLMMAGSELDSESDTAEDVQFGLAVM